MTKKLEAGGTDDVCEWWLVSTLADLIIRNAGLQEMCNTCRRHITQTNDYMDANVTNTGVAFNYVSDAMQMQCNYAKTDKVKNKMQLECGPMPNVMAALPNIGGALCSTPQSLTNAHYQSAVQ